MKRDRLAFFCPTWPSERSISVEEGGPIIVCLEIRTSIMKSTVPMDFITSVLRYLIKVSLTILCDLVIYDGSRSRCGRRLGDDDVLKDSLC